ncbi:sulfatase [Pedobacter sp. BS3]|uniref:sulfatase family protein n=1 Tax=Pedobacter sp. BS3 TaxID=2567937 RepID=UPI0011EE94FB|nr:sulfatase [Pedobacter sp. BS3]TZF84875.1 sulfatase [Pedobacter sp. BS3]
MRKPIKLILGIVIVILTVHLSANAKEQPNVILILMDDMGYGDPAFASGIGYSTPNMDQIAANGMRFTNFYAAQPVCTASRAGILTGCYPNRIGMYGAFGPWTKDALNPREETIASLLKKNGYQTCMVGKWGLGGLPPYLPLSYGFDKYYGVPYSNDMWPVDRNGKLITDTADKLYRYPLLPLYEGNNVVKHINTMQDQGELTQDYTKYACKFIKDNRDRPFFLYLAHAMVHVPIACSPAFRGKSKAGLFGDVMQEVDWSVGQIKQALKEAGVDKNTLIIFTSDNGPWLNYGNWAGNTGGLREGKITSFEGGQRVPCVMEWPGHIPVGTVCNKIAAAIDLLPTIAKICNAKLPERKIDGVDILPLLLNKPGADPRTEFAYYYRRNNLQAIRKDEWKLVFPHEFKSYKVYPPGNDGERGLTAAVKQPEALYNLAIDPGETIDVKAQHPDIVKQLNALANRYRADLGDDLTGAKGMGRRLPAACEPCEINFRKSGK